MLAKQAENVFFSQEDPRWAGLPYYFDDIGGSGCGLCAFTAAVNLLTGRNLSPLDVYRARQECGLDQRSDISGVCARDAHEALNDLNRRLFGVESEFLEDASIEGFRRALAGGDAVIWCSSRDTGEPWIWSDGSKQEWQHPKGHLVAVWKCEGGCFFLKDSSGPCCKGNNVCYTEEQFARWLVGVKENRYILRAAS